MPVVKLKGVAPLKRKLTGLAQKLGPAAGAALLAEAEIEMAEAKRRTPVDTGTLRASGHVSGETRRGRYMALLTFGGAAQAYAIKVHEDLEAFHKVGQAKFLESVLIESAPYMAQRIAARLGMKELL